MTLCKDANECKQLPKRETVFDILKKILPKREHWILEAMRILGSSNQPISSYEVTRRLNKSGLKTSISSVHPFLEVMINSGLCYRDPKWEMVGSKCVVGTTRGKEFCEILRSKLDNASTNDQ